jgi:hypothetical protein
MEERQRQVLIWAAEGIGGRHPEHIPVLPSFCAAQPTIENVRRSFTMATISHIEIAGVDGHRLQRFYADLFGWKITQRETGGFDYFDLGVSGSPSAGIRHEPDGHAEIVVYLEVDHLDEVVATAETLGASVRIPPMRHGNLRFALIQDPEGNPIGLTQHEAPDQRAEG